MKFIAQVQPEFVDERGGITKLLDDGQTVIKSVLYITSKAGSVRSNHYHKTDAHYIYMITGSMEYYEKPVDGAEDQVEKVIVKAGDIIYSPPMRVHATKFLEDSSFIALSINSRHQAAYEEDTVRVKWID